MGLLFLVGIFISALSACDQKSGGKGEALVKGEFTADNVTFKKTVSSNMPKANDVSIRTLQFREVPSVVPNALAAFKGFHADRLEWVYLKFKEEERAKIAAVKAAGGVFGGAGSASLGDTFPKVESKEDQLKFAMLDLNGGPVIQPHMRKWTEPSLVGDASNPEYRRRHAAYYQHYLDYGATTLQRDETEAVVFAAERYGGGFTETGLAGFQKWLKKNVSADELASLGVTNPATFDYAQYLRERGAPVGDAFRTYEDPIKPLWVRYWADTNTEFLTELIHDVKAYAKTPISFSCNNSSLQMWEPYHQVFDFAMSELLMTTANPVHLWERAQAAKALGKFQIFGAPKSRGLPVDPQEKISLERKVIATAYACGMACMFPWDVFDQTADGGGRYFADPKDFADLSGFIRSQAWDDFEEIGAVGEGIDDLPSVQITGGSGGVYAFLRSGRKEAPLMIHLVDWGASLVPLAKGADRSVMVTPSGQKIFYSASQDENLKRGQPEAFTLHLDRGVFKNTSAIEVFLKRPVKFDLAVHRKAEESRSYDQLVETTRLSVRENNEELLIDIPALTPWGVLEIRGLETLPDRGRDAANP